ncbi:MAG: glycosyltransferase [Deltaproteobacteria bacterium]|nr:glycosyltransferase [Deltaproteobacteria bacterium]
MAAPLITVALCTYNGASYLPAQLDSVLGQDYPSLEVLAFDDCSSDGTFELLQAYAARDPRLRPVRNPANLGFRRNFEQALRAGRGELVAPCDQDDVWRPDKLSRMQRALGESAAVYCDSALVDGDGRPLGIRLSERLAMRRFDDPAPFAFTNCVSGHALLLRRALLEEALPVPAHVYHDWWLAFVAAGRGGIDYLAEPLVAYRQHARSVTDIAGRRRRTGVPRPAGHRMATALAAGHRIRAMAAFPGPAQPLLAALATVWGGWERQVVAPRLTLFLLRHRRRLFVFRRGEARRRITRALGYLVGLRARRLLRPRAYASPESAHPALAAGSTPGSHRG